MLPYDSEVECRVNIVVYDSNTSLEKRVEGPAITCARYLWKMGSRNSVKILDGGYEEFSALYPFLRTQKIIYMPRELDEIKTYPAEIIPGFLYLGNRYHGNAKYIQKDLKIKTYINCCMEPGEISSQFSQNLHIPIEDSNDTDIYSSFMAAINFLKMNKNLGQSVLVYSDKGISRSASIVMAYLIYAEAKTLQVTYAHVKECSWSVRPKRGFIEQLSRWEAEAYGKAVTNIADPHY